MHNLYSINRFHAKNCCMRTFAFCGILLSAIQAHAIHNGKFSDHKAVGKIETWLPYGDIETCTLTRISRNYAITVSHCFREESTKKIRPPYLVWITFPDTPNAANPIQIIDKAVNLDEEIALVELPESLQSKNFIPVMLTDDQPKTAENLQSVGYGTAQNPDGVDFNLKSGFQRSAFLEYDSLKTYTVTHELSAYFPVTPNHSFLKFKRNETDKAMICSGDSGGPLLVETETGTKILGVASHKGGGKCSVNPFGFFIPLNEHAGWIKSWDLN